nr:MAG TPA: hypothetical protein [Caudoviricetes sp.]
MLQYSYRYFRRRICSIPKPDGLATVGLQRF